jgi:tetratricopeptide (TPR) repeat protein
MVTSNITTSISEKAFTAYKKKDFLAASEGFRECLKLLEDQQDILAAAEMRNNLSVVLLDLKKPDEALAIVQSTDLTFAAANDKKRQAMALGNIASALQALGRLEEALPLFEESAGLFNETGDKDLRAITLKKISDLQLKTGKHYQAMASLDASYDQLENKSIKDKILKGFLGTIIRKLTHR